ncbi:unnamed protein product [Polarella glacialis]|uniref:Methyltransferase FkbM domain-containing protein n=1 Tax=Polarella glacialis TaxID=89957 RepID=A0A813J3D1_POLGL|nr:unnamed protein product [Polarella glacialis]
MSTEGALSWIRQSSGPRYAKCWRDQLSPKDCCADDGCARVNQTFTPWDGGSECPWYGSSSCFDMVFVRSECCATGSAIVMPRAEPQPACPKAGQGRSEHPSFHPAQLRFEKSHKRATRFYEVTLLGVSLRVADFKASHKIRIIAEELLEDPYRLRALADLNVVNATFIDIGANVGFVSMLLAKMNPAAQVLSLEPVPEIYRYLLWNLKLNGLTDRVWPLNAGAGAEGCERAAYPLDTMFWWLPPTLPWGSSACLSWTEILSFARQLRPEGNSNNNKTDNNNNNNNSSSNNKKNSRSSIQFVKIDCEGCEFQMLRSAESRALASQFVERFAGEVHPAKFCEGESCLTRRLSESPELQQVLELLCWREGMPNPAMELCDHVLSGGEVVEVAAEISLDRSAASRCAGLARITDSVSIT